MTNVYSKIKGLVVEAVAQEMKLTQQEINDLLYLSRETDDLWVCEYDMIQFAVQDGAPDGVIEDEVYNTMEAVSDRVAQFLLVANYRDGVTFNIEDVPHATVQQIVAVAKM